MVVVCHKMCHFINLNSSTNERETCKTLLYSTETPTTENCMK